MPSSTYLGLGTAAIGRPQYINIRQEKKALNSLEEFKKQGISLLAFAYQNGINYIDTAPGYGMAEELVSGWLADRRSNSLDVASKWGYTYTANFDPEAKIHEVKEHSINKLNEQWGKSKELLPHLRYYQIHSATFESGVLKNEEVLHRLNELKEQYQLTIGLTTTGNNQIDVLQRASEIEINGSPLFGLYQITYNVFDQSLFRIVENIPAKLIIKEALANGRVFPNNAYPKYKEAYTLLNELAKTYKVTIDAIALRFCMDSIPVYKVLSGASTKQQLKNNLKSETFKLRDEDIEKLKGLKVSTDSYWKERSLLKWN